MTKGQILILLLIIALAFYLSETKQPKTPPLVKTKPQPAKSTYVINFPADEPVKLPTPKIEELLNEGWPVHFPSAQWIEEPNHPQPSNFKGLNPPHSQVDEPWEPPKPTKTPEPTIKLPPPEPEPTKAPLNCPSDQSVPDLEVIPAPEPSLNKSELTSEEQIQRKAQELADYHWLLNHKTITDWQQEQKLTSPQYQVLRSLVDNEEMNSLEHFLNLLPANYEWLLLNSEFKAQPTLIEQWKQHFTYHQAQDWLKIGLKPTDYALVAWLQNTKHLTPEEVLNFADLNQLKEEFNGN